MTACPALLSKSWTVGKRYRVTMTVPRPLPGQTACAVCEWEPTIPRSMTKQEEQDYVRGRNEAFALLNRK